MTLALGVDGGGTQTRCVVIDQHATLIGVGVSGASKPDAVDPEIGRVNLQQSVVAACQSCDGPGAVDTAFLGMGGVVSEADVNVVRNMLSGLAFRPDVPIGIDHDIRIALAAGTAGEPGIALIVGTGSSCYGRNAAGESWRSGGWGYILDDLGSGFYLGQQALTAVVRAFDGRGPETTLTAPIMEALDIQDLNEIMHHLYHPRLNHAGIAALAPIVTAAAPDDSVARSIIVHGCEELALMVATTARKLRLPADVIIIPVGSLTTASQFYRQELERAIFNVLPTAQIRAPLVPAVVGAALLALKQIGITPTMEALGQFHDTVI
jgi:N-acetylglucosamine kinase-like BadF-type ATPase